MTPTRRPAAVRRDAGQSLVEYALIVSLIVIVALVALTFFGTQIDAVLRAIAQQLQQ